MRAVNLIPAEQRRGAGGAAGRSDGAAFVILGLLAGMVLLAGLYAMSHSQISSRRAQATRLTAQANAMQAEANSLASYTAFLKVRDQRLTTVQQLAASRFDWAHAFHELGRVLPYDVSLSSVHGTVATTAAAAAPPPVPGATAAATATSSTPPGATPSVVITGCTVSQSEVAFMLTRLRLMDGVGNVDLHSSTAGSPSTPSSGSSGSDCPVTFSVTVTYSPMPAVATPAPSTTGAALTGTPATAAAVTGGH